MLQVYRQDCDTFGVVVKMLVAKDPSLEKSIQSSLRENLREIGQRCVDAMEQFIHEYDLRELGTPSQSQRHWHVNAQTRTLTHWPEGCYTFAVNLRAISQIQAVCNHRRTASRKAFFNRKAFMSKCLRLQVQDRILWLNLLNLHEGRRWFYNRC